MSLLGRFVSGTGAAPIETLTGNAGGAIGPSGTGNLNLVGGTNITTTGAPGTNTITITTTGPASFTWSVITVNQVAVVNNGYICNMVGTLAIALPATAVVGDLIEITGINTATGWQITQGAGQQIFLGLGSTTLGVGGTVTSTAIRDSIRLVCVVGGVNCVFQAISWVGNLTVI